MRAQRQTRSPQGSKRRAAGVALIIIGAVAFTACLRSMLAFTRDLVLIDGGACGTGRPNAILHQCSSADNRLLLVGLLGMVIATAVYAAGTSMLGRPAASAGQLAFVAVFGALGWQSVSLPVQSIGYLIGTIVFFGNALGALVPLLSKLVRDFRGGSRPVAISGQVRWPIARIARAVLLPWLGTAPPATSGGWSPFGATARGMTGAPAGAPSQSARPSPRAVLGIWLVTTACGAAAGVVLGSSLVSFVR
jgi:hypothetical protein